MLYISLYCLNDILLEPVTLDIPVTEEMKKGFLKGVNLSDGECKSAILNITGEYTCKVTLKEGRYHQLYCMW